MQSNLGDLRFEFFKERNASLLTHRQTLLLSGSGLASFLFHGIELAHEQEDGGGFAIFWVELESIVKFSAHMGKASRANYPGSADLFVALVAVALEDAPVISEQFSGTFRALLMQKSKTTGPPGLLY